MKKKVRRQRAENPDSWYAAGEMNKYIAEFLLQKYDSANKVYKKDLAYSVKQKVSIRDEHSHRYVLMFYGLVIENYLKACLVKEKKIPIFKDENDCLSHDIKTHKVSKLFKDYFGSVCEI